MTTPRTLHRTLHHLGLTLLLSLGLASLAVAQVVQLRIGTVVPKNSLYHQQLMEMGEAWRAAPARPRHPGCHR